MTDFPTRLPYAQAHAIVDGIARRFGRLRVGLIDGAIDAPIAVQDRLGQEIGVTTGQQDRQQGPDGGVASIHGMRASLVRWRRHPQTGRTSGRGIDALVL